MTIVTGGAGFVGSHLVALLVERGEPVRVIEKPGVNAAHLPREVELIEADIRDAAAMRTALQGGDRVYHLAANPNLWARDRGEFDAVNHRGTINVLDAAIAAGARRIVHCSTESILTCTQNHNPISEDVEITESDAVGPYCLSKLRAEEAARSRALAGHCVLIANPTMPIGPGDRGGMSPPTRLIRDFCRGTLIGYVDATLNLIDVRDVAIGLSKVMDLGRPGRRYLLGACNLTLLELFQILSRLTGQRVPGFRVPYALALVVAQLSELWADFVTRRHPKATITGVRLTRRTMVFESSRSQNELGLQPRDIEGSLRETVEWLRQLGELPARPLSHAHSA